MIWGLREQRRCSGLRIPLSFLPERETHLQGKSIPLSVSSRFAPVPWLGYSSGAEADSVDGEHEINHTVNIAAS